MSAPVLVNSLNRIINKLGKKRSNVRLASNILTLFPKLFLLFNGVLDFDTQLHLRAGTPESGCECQFSRVAIVLI